MKILVVQESDWVVKGPCQQHHLMERLILKGHDVRVIDYEILWRQGKCGLYSARKVFEISRACEAANSTVIRPAIVKFFVFDYVSMILTHGKELSFQLKTYQPDVVVGLGILNTYMARLLTQNSSTPFFYYLIDTLHMLIPFKLLQPMGKLLESATLSKSDKVVVINEKLKDYALALGANKENTSIIGAGIDLTRFRLNICGDEVRARYNIGSNDSVLFFMGWLYKFSGLPNVLSEMAKNKELDLKCLIVGNGDIYEDLKKLVQKFDLQDKVIFTGYVPYKEIPELIAAADICMLPADPCEKIMQDIVPIKLYEYMAMQKPVISTNLPGIRKEFGEDNGIVYVNTPEDVLYKALEILQNGMVRDIGVKGRKFVEQRSWNRITDEFESLLLSAIEEKHFNFRRVGN